MPATASVLIPTYNVADIAARAIRSALAQDCADVSVEVIVIDDASEDETAKAVNVISRQDSRVRLLRLRANGGPGVARAVGLSEAVGDWVAVLDADDEMEPGRLQRLVTIAHQEDLDVIADNLSLYDPLAGPVGVAFPLVPADIVPVSPERLLANSIPGGRVNLGWMKPVVHRQFLTSRAISWRSVRHGEDALFMLEVLLAGGRAALIGEPGYRYTQRRGSVSGAASEHSRTRRNAEEQIRALEVLERAAGNKMSPAVKRRLAEMRPEIRATTHVLEALDRLRERRHLAAACELGSAASFPVALGRCVAARFGPRSRRVV